MDRIYDLNNRQKSVTAVIRVSDKEFRISRVVTGVRVLYSNLLTEMGERLKEICAVDSAKASKEELQSLVESTERFAKEKSGKLEQCMELLLTRNGYEYDRQWWDGNTDEYDVRCFIEACLSKDADGSKKK